VREVWVGPGAGIDAVTNGKISSYRRILNAGHLADMLVTVQTKLSQEMPLYFFKMSEGEVPRPWDRIPSGSSECIS